MDSEIFLRNMQQEDLEAAMDLKTAEGWNQTKADWDLFLTQHPRLCLVAKAEGKTVGTVTAFVYEDKLAWIGMMLVNPRFRRKGISKRLILELMDRLSFCPTIKLDATPAGQFVYEKLGFKKEYSLFRWIRKPVSLLPNNDLSPPVFKLGILELRDLMELDAQVFGANRELVLRHICRSLPEGAFVCREQGGVKGFLLCRKGSRYVQLGPMVAENDTIAKALLHQALMQLGEKEVVLDMAANRSEMKTWLEQQGFEVQRELIRMYLRTNACPGIPEKYYLMAGPELG